MNENLENYGFSDNNKMKIEEWFDEHPIPWDVEVIRILNNKLYNISIYCAKDFKDDYMIKIICNNAHLALNLSNELNRLAEVLGLEKILIGKKLFLLRRSFFQL